MNPAAPRGWSAGRSIATVLVFLALGPLVGGLVMIIGISAGVGIGTGDYGGMFAMFATMVIYGLWASWPMGILPALAVGVAIAIADGSGRNNWRFAGAAGSIAGIAVMVGGNALSNPGLAVGLFSAAVIASLVCYAATRGIAGR